MRKQFAVLGLGSFGRSVALTLESMGCDVIVVDKSRETIQEIADRVTYAITADITEKEALSALGTRNLDGAIIGVAENLEAGIMATLLCKEIGIPMVVAKAKNKLQGTILKKVGADTVVYPEIEMGSRVAKSLFQKWRWGRELENILRHVIFQTGLICQMITVWLRSLFQNRGSIIVWQNWESVRNMELQL